MRVAGIGCRKGVAVGDVLAAVEAALAAFAGARVDVSAPDTPSLTHSAGHLSPASRGEESPAAMEGAPSSPPQIVGERWPREAGSVRGGPAEESPQREVLQPDGRESGAGDERFGIAVLDALATSETKTREPAIIDAAKLLRLPLIPVTEPDLQHAAARCLTRSAASLAATGIPSLAEAAALAAAGEASRLLGPRIATGNVTCAIAQDRNET